MTMQKKIGSVFISVVLCLSGCSPRPPKQEEAPILETSVRKINPTPLDKQDEINALLEGLKQKNPFCPDHSRLAVSSEAPVRAGENELKGIVWDAQSPYALIGEKVVMVGDYLGGKKVIRINRDSVVFESNGQEEILRLQMAIPRDN